MAPPELGQPQLPPFPYFTHWAPTHPLGWLLLATGGGIDLIILLGLAELNGLGAKFFTLFWGESSGTPSYRVNEKC